MGSRLRWSVRAEWCRDLGLALCAGADLMAWMVHRVSWPAVCLGAIGLGLMGRGYPVPVLGQAGRRLRQSGGAGDEPPVKVGGALAPAADVDAGDLADREHGTLDAAEHDALLACEVVGELGGAVVVLARLEDQ